MEFYIIEDDILVIDTDGVPVTDWEIITISCDMCRADEFFGIFEGEEILDR